MTSSTPRAIHHLRHTLVTHLTRAGEVPRRRTPDLGSGVRFRGTAKQMTGSPEPVWGRPRASSSVPAGRRVASQDLAACPRRVGCVLGFGVYRPHKPTRSPGGVLRSCVFRSKEPLPLRTTLRTD